MEDKAGESLKNISGKWMDSIYDSLERLETYERTAREGFKSLTDWIQSQYDQTPKMVAKNLQLIKYQNLRYMISELKILIPKAKFHFEDKEFKLLKTTIKMFESFLRENLVIEDGRRSNLTSRSKSDTRGNVNFYLEDGFEILFEMVIEIKDKILDDLDNIVFEGKKERDQRES